MSVATQAGEQQVFAKAMAPVVRSGTTTVSDTNRFVKTLEQAINALSSPFAVLKEPSEGTNAQDGPKNSVGTSIINRMSTASDVTVPSELGLSVEMVNSAEEVVLNARRKQSILLEIVMIFQRHCRMHLREEGPRLIRARISKVLSMQLDQRSREMKEYDAANRIRGFLLACRFRHGLKSRIERKAIAVARLQGIVRGRRTRYAFGMIRNAIVLAQALCRGFITRRRLTVVIQGRLHRYRNHIFVLWMKSHTSLCYRAKFWPLIQQDGMIPLVFAEDEILRLWIERALQTSLDPEDDDASNDDILRVGRLLGVSDQLYLQLRKVSRFVSMLLVFGINIRQCTNTRLIIFSNYLRSREKNLFYPTVTWRTAPGIARSPSAYRFTTVLFRQNPLTTGNNWRCSLPGFLFLGRRRKHRFQKRYVRFWICESISFLTVYIVTHDRTLKHNALSGNIYDKADESSAFMIELFPEL